MKGDLHERQLLSDIEGRPDKDFAQRCQCRLSVSICRRSTQCLPRQPHQITSPGPPQQIKCRRPTHHQRTEPRAKGGEASVRTKATYSLPADPVLPNPPCPTPAWYSTHANNRATDWRWPAQALGRARVRPTIRFRTGPGTRPPDHENRAERRRGSSQKFSRSDPHPSFPVVIESASVCAAHNYC